MDTLTKDGQILIGKDAAPLHIMGDLGLTKGQQHADYFRPVANYERTGADGAKERLKNYTRLTGADAAFCREMYDYYELHGAILRDVFQREGDTPENREKLRLMHERLKGEGVPLDDIYWPKRTK